MPNEVSNWTSTGTAAAMSEDRATWRKVLTMLRARKMPPEDNPRPKAEEYAAVSAWLEATLDQADRVGSADPGRVTIRRLNRTEYTNTIRDLLGVEFNAAAGFPSDDVGYGFDNIGDVLTLPPLLMEKYLDAAEQIAAKAIAADKPSGNSKSQQPHLCRRTGREIVARCGCRADSSPTCYAGVPPPDQRRRNWLAC